MLRSLIAWAFPPRPAPVPVYIDAEIQAQIALCVAQIDAARRRGDDCATGLHIAKARELRHAALRAEVEARTHR